MEETFELAGASVVPDPELPGTYLYAPTAPSVALDGQGRPQLNLLIAGPTTFLQVTGSYGLSEAQLAALRAALGARTGLDPASLTLRPRYESVDKVALELTEPDGVAHDLQVTRSSGVPPHHAVFNVVLDAGQRAAVEAALAGQRDRLALRYEVRRHPVAGPATLTRSSTYETTRSVSDGVEHAATTIRETAEGSGPAPGPPATLILRSDAADWTARR